MLLTLRFEPSRFFLKGKNGTKNKQHVYISTGVNQVWKDSNTKDFIWCSFHTYNFLCYFMFMWADVAWVFFCLTLPLRKNLLGSKHKAYNIYFAFILQVL